MPDIAMCPGKIEDGNTIIVCPIRDKCHRYMTKAGPVWQTYIVPPTVGDDCEYYWPVKWEPKSKN